MKRKIHKCCILYDYVSLEWKSKDITIISKQQLPSSYSKCCEATTTITTTTTSTTTITTKPTTTTSTTTKNNNNNNNKIAFFKTNW
jgi:hypothetical protein